MLLRDTYRHEIYVVHIGAGVYRPISYDDVKLCVKIGKETKKERR